MKCKGIDFTHHWMLLLVLVIALGALSLALATLTVQAAPVQFLSHHCGDGGPLPVTDPDYCGCTWGAVMFQGQPVAGAVVTLTFEGRSYVDTTRVTVLEPEPYFDISGYNLGARKGDVLTLTATFAGQLLTRTFRAWPDASGEQQIILALPDRGVWTPWTQEGYTRTIAVKGDSLWAAGINGVMSASLTTREVFAQTLPGERPTVLGLTIGNDDHVWAVGPAGVTEFDGTTWYVHTLPTSETPRAVVFDPHTGAIWVGGGDSGGYLATYSGTWQIAGNFTAPVTALVMDTAERVWAGTWGAGAYRQNGAGGWEHYQSTDGLTSDWIRCMAVGEAAVWFGTEPYLSGSGPRGGISRYALLSASWQTYTTAHGLPADLVLSSAPAPIYALAVDEEGWMWAGTREGIRYLADGAQWLAYTQTHGLQAGQIQALAAGSDIVIAAGSSRFDRLDKSALPGNPPTAQIVAVTPLTVTAGTTVTLSGSGTDGDESGQEIVAWEWRSDLAGPLCTTAACQIPADLLMNGVHQLSFRVVDDEGVWSKAATVSLLKQGLQRVYLPLVIR